MGRLGILFEITMRTALYVPHTTTARSLPLAKSSDILDVLDQHRKIQASNSSRRMRLEFRIELGDLQEHMYEWPPKENKVDIPLADGFSHFKNPAYFRFQPSMLSGGVIKLGLQAFQLVFASAAKIMPVH